MSPTQEGPITKILFFLIIAIIITARHMIGLHFQKKFGKNAKVKLIDQKKSFIQRKLSSSLIDSDSLLQKIEEKALWSRYGL